MVHLEAPGWLSGFKKKKASATAGEADLIPGPGGSPGDGNGNPLQYLCLGNSTDRGARRATGNGITESNTT